MELSTLVDLGPGHIVLDGDPAPLPNRGWISPTFGPHLLRRNSSRDEDATWYGRRTRSRRLSVRWDTALPSQKRAEPPIFARVFAAFFCGEMDGWIKMVFGTG